MEKICDTEFDTYNKILNTFMNKHTEENFSDKWFNLPWKKFQRESYRLQRRIYEASKKNDHVKVKGLQKLMYHTYQARMIAIRKVTQCI